MRRYISVLLMISLLLLVSCGPEDPIVTTWLPSEIIGQGELTRVEVVNSNWLITLELMSAKSTSEQVITDSFVYYLDGNLRVGSGYVDTKIFRLGYYYVLYRKIEGATTQFYLDLWQGVKKETR